MEFSRALIVAIRAHKIRALGSRMFSSGKTSTFSFQTFKVRAFNSSYQYVTYPTARAKTSYFTDSIC